MVGRVASPNRERCAIGGGHWLDTEVGVADTAPGNEGADVDSDGEARASKEHSGYKCRVELSICQ